MLCPSCGEQNDDRSAFCSSCGKALAPVAPPVQTGDATLEALIPYRNAKALTSYYLGVFSLIPVLGIPLGIAAFVLGIQGLSLAKERPEVKGKAHAWTGIILGGLFSALYVIVLLMFIVA